MLSQCTMHNYLEKTYGQLSPQAFWSEREPFLREYGYSLKSFEIKTSRPLKGSASNGVCAFQHASGRLVYIKRTETFGKEFAIALYLSAPPLLGDPRNPHPPLLESFPDEDDERLTYMVMPYLRPLDLKAMKTVNDVLELGSQLLLGLRFLHDIQILHQNITPSLIMMEEDGSPRPKYFLLNYSNACPSLDLVRRYRHLVHKHTGASHGLGRDCDIRAMGFLLQSQYVDKYRNLAFLQPLVTKMTTGPYVWSYICIKEWAEMTRRVPWFKRRALLREKDRRPNGLAGFIGPRLKIGVRKLL